MGGKEDEDLEDPGGAPACSINEVDPAYMGLEPVDQIDPYKDLKAWRQAERDRLVAIRRAIPPDERQRLDELVLGHVVAALGDLKGKTVALYWPIKGEPNLTPLFEVLEREGGEGALPVVIAQRTPLTFRTWSRGAPLEKGVWNIMIPEDGAPEVTPHVVIVPLVGFDAACHRLGNGGGFYDRTLAQLSPRPRTVGVGYAATRIRSIYPEPHDIPMDEVITEDGRHLPVGGSS